MGTGPFILKSWVAGDRLVLERNPNYWRSNATANGWDFFADTITITGGAVTSTPEPSSALILLSGALGLLLARRRR